VNLDRELKPIENVDEETGEKLADLSSRSTRGVIYQALLKKYRKTRTTPRPDVLGVACFEDPAPDWLWMLARDILEHTLYEDDLGLSLLTEAITWCEAGDEVARSARLRDPKTRASTGRIGDAVYVSTMRKLMQAAYLEPGYLHKVTR